MNITEKDILLADYLDGKISESALLKLHPEWREDIEMIKLSQNALNKLEPVFYESGVQIPFDKPTKKILPKRIWYVAASIIILVVVGLSLIKSKDNKKLSIDFEDVAQSENAGNKIIALWDLWQENNMDKRHLEQLLELAVHDNNSNVRYMALQKFTEQPLPLSQKDLYQYIDKEKSFNNQTAWIELWVKLYNNDSNVLRQWLSKEGVNPLVREYGVQVIENI